MVRTLTLSFYVEKPIRIDSRSTKLPTYEHCCTLVAGLVGNPCIFANMSRRGPLPVPLDIRFLDKHEERMVEEQRFLRETAEEKYRRTHNYNIIAGTYYDQNKERKFVDAREKLGVMQGRAQQYRLPPSIRYGEGNDYNIINQQVTGSTYSAHSVFAHPAFVDAKLSSVNNHATVARQVVLTRNVHLSFPREFGVLLCA